METDTVVIIQNNGLELPMWFLIISTILYLVFCYWIFKPLSQRWNWSNQDFLTKVEVIDDDYHSETEKNFLVMMVLLLGFVVIFFWPIGLFYLILYGLVKILRKIF